MKVNLTVQKGAETKQIVFITVYEDHTALHEYFIQKFWLNWLAELNGGLVDVNEVLKFRRLETVLYHRLMLQTPSGWRVVTYHCVDI